MTTSVTARGASSLPEGVEVLQGLEREPNGDWRVTGRTPAFKLDPTRLRGRWIICTADLPREVAPVGLAFQIRRQEGSRTAIGHTFITDAKGHAAWIGHVPADADTIRLDVITAADTFKLQNLRVRIVGRPELMIRALAVNPRDALKAALWRIAGKKVRARGRMATAAMAGIVRRMRGSLGLLHTDDYSVWLYMNESFQPEALEAMRDRVLADARAPVISVLMPVYNPPPQELEEAIESVREQIYPKWELSIADDASPDPRIGEILERAAASDPRIKVTRRAENGHISAASNSALDRCTGTFTALMDHDDLIPPHALLFVAQEIVEPPDADLVYSDEDKIDEKGRRYMPHFKSDWNEELFLSQNYINHLGVYRTEILKRIGGFRVGLEGSQDHDLVFRFLEHTDETKIRHIPRVLYHWRNHRQTASFSEKSMEKAVAARRKALSDLIARRGLDAEVGDGPYGTNRLIRRLPEPLPEVAVIIPTRDRANLLRVACEGLLTGTDYPKLRVIVVDNESREPETAALFDELRRDPRVTILPSPGAFNFSKLNNEAAALVTSELLLLMNNDIEIEDRGWLKEMVSTLHPGVAAVGARLLYPDRTVQHAGVVLGAGGVAGHAFIDLPEEDAGYFGRARLPQYVSAVTAACLLVRRECYEAVGGLDEKGLTVAFNDIDFCLKLRAKGWKIVYNPYVTLLHHESASRGLDKTPEKRERFEREISTMLDRWGPVLRRDPYYNPNLELDFADYRLKGHLRPTPPKHVS